LCQWPRQSIRRSDEVRQQVDVIPELRDVLEGETSGALEVASGDQRGDLPELAIAPRGRAHRWP
jgi:hypothetical protein